MKIIIHPDKNQNNLHKGIWDLKEVLWSRKPSKHVKEIKVLAQKCSYLHVQTLHNEKRK